MAIAAKLTRVSTDEGVQDPHPLRTPVTRGWFETPPRPGHPFVFGADALEDRDVHNARLIRTSVVQEVTTDIRKPEYRFRTLNSNYTLEIEDGNDGNATSN